MRCPVLEGSTTNLPPSVLATANLAGEEEAWPISAFLAALDESAAAGFACLGDQFQFRFPDGICEMYWLEANARDQELSRPSLLLCVFCFRRRISGTKGAIQVVDSRANREGNSRSFRRRFAEFAVYFKLFY